MNIFDNQAQLIKLEQQRANKEDDIMTFNCFHCLAIGDRAVCKGKLLGHSKDGSMAIISVLRGMTSGTCRRCQDYDEED